MSGKTSAEELWRHVLDELKLPQKFGEVMSLVQGSGYENVHQQMLDLSDKLRARGYKTGLLSNNTKKEADSMRQKGIDKHFDVFQISAETGLVKPEPAAFSHFAQALDVRLKELIFIDDSKNSLSTAEQVGYKAILFRDYDALIAKLEKLGIEL
jgi:putative hydrolase of the HAD superfamily